MDAPAQSSFVRSRLPWVVAAVGFILYLVTLNRWVSLNSLAAVSSFLDPKVTPPLSAPLLYLVTLPLQLLPSSLQLTGLNALSALCGGLTLALLARSVALLPHDRTREERHRLHGGGGPAGLPFAWAPPILAAAVLGSQISFWEHATAATGEMLNLMLLAYVVRCVLEYRGDPRESWLSRLALVYGLATANSYAMIAYFPLALTALIWVRGASFFQAGFIIRTTLWGMAGLLVYLVIPLIMVLQEDNVFGYGEILRYELVQQWIHLRTVSRLIAVMGALTSVVPLFLIGIRWPSTFGDTSAVGNLLINVAFRVVYLVFAGFILWMMLGGEFAPRAQTERVLSSSMMPVPLPAYLSFYYLAALALGYFVGYCLLVFGIPEPQRHRRRQAALSPAWRAVAALPALAALATAVYLTWTNAPVVRMNNGQLLKDFASRAVQALPSEPAVVLADQPRILTLVNTLLSQQGLGDRHLLVNTLGLQNPAYQRELNRRAPHLWPDYFAGTNNLRRLLPPRLLALEIGELVRKTPAYYLHPSFGYFFERVVLEPQGLIYRLQPWPTNALTPPLPSQELMRRNGDFYQAMRDELAVLTSKPARNSPDARTVAKWYSLALNYWGVVSLRSASDQLESTTQLFEQARELNPDNRSAEINLQFARARQTGQARSSFEGKTTDQILGKRYRKWDQLLSIDGPLDEPVACLLLGQELWNNTLARQAIVELQRALELSPANQRQPARFGLAIAYSGLNAFDRVLDLARDIQDQQPQFPIPDQDLVRLYCLEAGAMRGRDGNIAAAEQHLLAQLARRPITDNPGSILLINTLGRIYLEDQQRDKALALVNGQLALLPASAALAPVENDLLMSKTELCDGLQLFDQANEVLDKVLARDPERQDALLYKGVIAIKQEQYTNAIPHLDRLVLLAPEAILPRLNRAIALLKSGQLEAAKSDYFKLLELIPNGYQAHYGLGEIAWRQKDYKSAAEHYEAYLNAAANTASQPDPNEVREVNARLESIESGTL